MELTLEEIEWFQYPEITIEGQAVKPCPGSGGVFHVMAAVLIKGQYPEACGGSRDNTHIRFKGGHQRKRVGMKTFE